MRMVVVLLGMGVTLASVRSVGAEFVNFDDVSVSSSAGYEYFADDLYLNFRRFQGDF